MVEGGSLENCCAVRYRGFESYFLRHLLFFLFKIWIVAPKNNAPIKVATKIQLSPVAIELRSIISGAGSGSGTGGSGSGPGPGVLLHLQYIVASLASNHVHCVSKVPFLSTICCVSSSLKSSLVQYPWNSYPSLSGSCGIEVIRLVHSKSL